MRNEEIRMLTEVSRGRLHKVKKTLKEFICFDCNESIPIKSICYTQNIKTQEQFFPEKIRICEKCKNIQELNGIEIVQ